MTKLKRLTLEDLAIFRNLRRSSVTADDRTLITTPEEEEAKSDEDLAMILTKDVVLAAFKDEDVAGMVTLERHKGRHRCHAAEVQWLFVLPAYRRQGLAQAILTAIEEQAKSLGIECLELHVVADNDGAIKLYEHMEYRKYGVLPNAVKKDAKYTDGIFMAKIL